MSELNKSFHDRTSLNPLNLLQCLSFNSSKHKCKHVSSYIDLAFDNSLPIQDLEMMEKSIRKITYLCYLAYPGKRCTGKDSANLHVFAVLRSAQYSNLRYVCA